MRKIELVELGLVDYHTAMKKMRQIHKAAVQKGDTDFLIMCQHYDVYTAGQNENREFPVAVVKTDRGGSVVFHTPGQQIFYFVFRVKSPVVFYRKVVRSFEAVLKQLDSRIVYVHRIPGFYVENRKLGFLGFRFENGYSLHGVAINNDVDLQKFNLIEPCGLKGYTATSLRSEGVEISEAQLKETVVKSVLRNFA